MHVELGTYLQFVFSYYLNNLQLKKVLVQLFFYPNNTGCQTRNYIFEC